MKITAAEAKVLAGPTIEERVDSAFDQIRKAATEGKRELHLHDDFWARGGYSKTPEWTKALQLLTAEGFQVDFFYEEKQFVNMYTLVKW